MRIDKIKYEQLLPTGSYLNCRYGIEISISEDAETDRAFELAKQIVSDTHKKQFPAMYKDNAPIHQGEDALPEIQQNKTPEISKEVMDGLDGIKNSETLEELKSNWWLISKNNLTLSTAYKAKLKQFEDAGSQE